jgi:hypothetical protein
MILFFEQTPGKSGQIPVFPAKSKLAFPKPTSNRSFAFWARFPYIEKNGSEIGYMGLFQNTVGFGQAYREEPGKRNRPELLNFR